MFPLNPCKFIQLHQGSSVLSTTLKNVPNLTDSHPNPKVEEFDFCSHITKWGFYHQTQQDSTKKVDSNIKAQQDSTIQFEVILCFLFGYMFLFQKLSVPDLQALRTCHIVFHPACIASRTGFNLNSLFGGWQLTSGPHLGHHCIRQQLFRVDMTKEKKNTNTVNAKIPHRLLREPPRTFDTKDDRLPDLLLKT